MDITAELIRLLWLIISIVAVMAFVALCAIVFVLLERKVAGRIHKRPGPFEVGPHGALQTTLDAVKLIGKQTCKPAGADWLLFWLAPLVTFGPVLVLFLPMPFGPVLTSLEVNLGLLLILAFSGLTVLAFCMAGWGSNNKWSLLGAARSLAQRVGYEIPLLLSVLAVVFQRGSLNLSEIVSQQGPWPWQWNILTQPLAFLIYFICALAETNRNPFDLPEAESELTAGYHTEYSGMGFALFFLGEYAYLVVVCCVAAALFLGGWQAPILPGFWWFLAKAFALVLLAMWFRWTYPRLRFDQLLNLNWQWLLPLSLANLIATAFLMKVF